LLPPRLGRTCRPCLRVQASLGDKWTPPEEITQLLNEIYKRVQPMANSLVSAIQTALKLQRQWVQQAWARSLLAWAIALGLVTAIANAWGVPALNQKLPHLAQQAAVVLQRDVHIGRIYWIAPTGISGLHPLASVGPITLGEGPVERSTATLERVSLGFSPIQSIFRGRLVLTVRVGGAEVHLKQADNFSWFGFPDDTTPSSRDFVPGLNENPKSKNGKGGNGGVSGGGSASGGANAPATSNSLSSSSRRFRNTTRNIAAAPKEVGGTSSSSPVLDTDERTVAAAETLIVLNATKISPSLASISVSSAPSPSSRHNDVDNTTSTSTAATRITSSTLGWRSLFPFQSNSQKDAEREEKKRIDARKQQLDKLNSIKFSAAGGSSITISSKDTRSSIEGSKLPVEEAPGAAASASEIGEGTISVASAADADARSVISGTAATSLDDLDTSSVAIDSTTTTAAADVPPLERENEKILPLSSGGRGSENATAGPLETLPMMSSTRAASILNSLPSLSIDIRSRSNIAAEEEEEKIFLQQQREPPVESSAVKSINSLGEIAKGQIAPPVEILQKDPKLAHFKEIVLDQATVRKKGKELFLE